MICLRLIGDVVLATAAIGQFRRRWPDAAIDVLANRGTGEFLEKDPRVRQVIYHESPREPGIRRAGGGGYLGRILLRYDLALSLNPSDRGTIAALFAGRRGRAGFLAGDEGLGGRAWKRLFLTAAIPYPHDLHIADLSTPLLRALGETPGQPEVRIFWDDRDEEAVAALLSPLGGRPFLVLHPAARWPFKEVPDQALAEAAGRVAGARGWGVVVTAGPSPAERARLESLQFPGGVPVVKVAGTLSLNGVACLVSRARLYLGLDTAVTHIAASTGTPLVALYGPTPLWHWGPWNNQRPAPQYPVGARGDVSNGRIRVLQRDWTCVPCGRKGCEDSGQSRCLREVTPDEIVSGCEEALGAP